MKVMIGFMALMVSIGAFAECTIFNAQVAEAERTGQIATEDKVISKLMNRMEARGYKKVNTPEEASLILEVKTESGEYIQRRQCGSWFDCNVGNLEDLTNGPVYAKMVNVNVKDQNGEVVDFVRAADASEYINTARWTPAIKRAVKQMKNCNEL